jgi:hypothetical protein
VSGDWEYIEGIYTTAANLYADAAPREIVTAQATLVSSEQSGVVSYLAAGLVYEPGRVVTFPVSGPLKKVTLFLGPVFTLRAPGSRLLNTSAGDQPFSIYEPADPISFSMMATNTGVTVAIWGDMTGTEPQYLGNVDVAANVIYGEGRGISSATALYCISLSEPTRNPIFE